MSATSLEKKHLIIVGYGPVAGYKYSRCIKQAIDRGEIDSYSIVDLESQSDTVLTKIEDLAVQPEAMLFIPNDSLTNGPQGSIPYFDAFCKDQADKLGCELKVVIATEAQAHESYLRYCIDNDIDSLVTKPIILPMEGGIFDPTQLTSKMVDLVRDAKKGNAQHDVLCLGRQHEIFEEGVRLPIQAKMDELGIPITSLHLKTGSGVWNLPEEFDTREDHPYKYGYGMLMHGAYHYVDLVSTFLRMNSRVLPDHDFTLDVNSYVAGVADQSLRIPQGLSERLKGFNPKSLITTQPHEQYGETDIVTNFRLRSETSGQTVTMGTLSMEQTTPGMRSWTPFPEVPYNINGRLYCTDMEARLSTAYATNGHIVKIPLDGKNNIKDLRCRNFGRVTTRSNALIANSKDFHHEYTLEREYGNSFSYTSEMAIFDDWLASKDTKSSLASHLPSVSLLQGLAESARNEGQQIRLDFSREAYGTEHLKPGESQAERYASQTHKAHKNVLPFKVLPFKVLPLTTSHG